MYHNPKDSNESGHQLFFVASLWTFVKKSNVLDMIHYVI